MPPAAIVDDDCSTASFSVKDDLLHMKTARNSASRRIEFVDVSEFRIHEFDAFEDEERDEIWYSRDEYDIIKARNSLIIKMMKSGTFDESEEHSFRGLENKLKEGFKKRRAHKFSALNAVLEEQDRQISKGTKDDEAIGEAYRAVSLPAKEGAFELACLDVEDSFAYTGKPVPRESFLGMHMSFRNEEEEAFEAGDDDDNDTVCSEDSRGSTRKSRLGRFLGGVKKAKEQQRRRISRRSSM
jgi:hypothetical protein